MAERAHSGPRLRVLVAEDHPVYRDGLRAMLEAAPEVELVGEATTGEEAVRRAAELRPDVILMYIQLPVRNGIDATRAIDAVGHGGAVFGPGVARRISAFFAAGELGPHARPFPELTERERQVLERMARGEGNAIIADRLGLSLKTVRNYASTIFDKLMVATRAEAIVRAREAGLGTPDGREPRPR